VKRLLQLCEFAIASRESGCHLAGCQPCEKAHRMMDHSIVSNPRQLPAKHLLYVADPMCSWCYGFAPAITEVAQRLAGHAPLRLVMGGLRPGETRPNRDKDKDYLRQAWAHVAQASGQAFNPAFFEREHFIYDTEPACRAVVTIRHVYPREALSFLARLSSAFYADNRDITQTDVLGDIVHEAGFNRAEFLAAFQSDSARADTQQDFAMCLDAGIRGFPTLLAGTDRQGPNGPERGYRIITRGFCALDDMAGALEQWAAE
jgi:putative protein-disulfide isomerase